MSIQSTSWRRSIPILFLIAALCTTLISATTRTPFPDVISLPNGFNPEGIASGNGTTFYAGSILTGAVYRGDFATGSGDVLVPPQEGHSSIGMKYDPRTDYLYVAGGTTCKAFVYNASTDETVAEILLTTGPCFINDVVITQDAAYFTNSFQAVIYKVTRDPETGEFTSVEIPLGGDYEFVSGGFNANGIDALPNGKALIIVNSTTGKLYLVDPITGNATLIDLGGGSVATGDGILLVGKTLYVVQNALNQIAVIELAPDYSSGEITSLIKNDNFDVPTTIAKFGDALYAVNARFGTPVTPDTEYTVVRVPLH